MVLFAHGKRAFTPSLGETHKFTQENIRKLGGYLVAPLS